MSLAQATCCVRVPSRVCRSAAHCSAVPASAGWSVLVPGQSFSTGLQLPWLNGSGEVKIKFNYLCVLALLL